MSPLDHPLISERYFFPRRAALPDATTVRGPGGKLACWRSAAASERPVLLHFHGNGEIVHDWMQVFPPLVAGQGFDVFLAEYRGYGASDGSPALGSMLDDIPAIFAALGLPPEQVVVFGRSVGSIYAIEAARRFPNIAGLVLESGIHDVLERLLLRVQPQELGVSLEELRQEVDARLNPRAKLAGFAGPMLVMHCVQDGLVDMSHAERNHAAAPRARSKLVRFSSGDHNSILFANSRRYAEELDRFLADCRGA